MSRTDDRESRVYAVLEELGIAWERFEHPPVATVDEAAAHWTRIDATHCKNLFLRNKKGDRHYLVVLEHRKQADLRALASRIGDDRLSFGSPDRLLAHLGLTPGAVSPFGLINDAGRRVRVVIDADLKQAAFLAFHPNVNTATVRLSRADFERFLAWSGHPVHWIALPTSPSA
jgi:Ala-tRNA(Pro) deacylase